MTDGPLHWGPRRAVRVTVAVLLTTATVLQTLTIIGAAVGGGPTVYAAQFFFTGVLVLILAWMSVVAWHWVARSAHERSEHLRVGVPDEPEPRDHLGLNGEIEPPKRW
jgi:hypothetical protein